MKNEEVLIYTFTRVPTISINREKYHFSTNLFEVVGPEPDIIENLYILLISVKLGKSSKQYSICYIYKSYCLFYSLKKKKKLVQFVIKICKQIYNLNKNIASKAFISK